ncbi:MAG TPA: TIGR04013 family B12-binding domain/radical SAM domain-containing protein [Anaeromyxobacteraceae bacterium]|nr:TIGR04013 family B12-binding domain/radical SAM domain-containing protein [Anaeromyxobacteraceae bacterium]
MPGAELVLHYRRTSRHALNVLLAAVEQSPACRRVGVRIAEGPEEAARAARETLAAGARPVVAWSFYSAGAAEVAAELSRVSALAPDPRVLHVAGGAHATGDPEGTLAAGFHLAAVGEGEETLPALLARVAAGDDPRAVPGLAWRESGRLRTSGRAAPVDLEAVPAFAAGAGRLNPIEITRGCAWACRFCQTPFLARARFRHRSLDSVRRGVRYLSAAGARDVRFLTPSALSYGAEGPEANLDAVEALLAAAGEEARAGMRLFLGTFPSELRPEHVSPRALAILARRCANRTVILGGQSGSDRMLAAMGRGHVAADVLRAARYALEAGFRPDVDLLFGLPGETGEDREATRRLAGSLAALGARVHAHAFMPLPGTPWGREPPGEIDPATRALLERLASRGAAHGPWKAQQSLARRLREPGSG